MQHSRYALDERIRIGTPMFSGDVGRLYLMVQEALVLLSKVSSEGRDWEHPLEVVARDVFFALTGKIIKITSEISHESES